jgi:thermostable 8-oxoguanine DNA glycosylase
LITKSIGTLLLQKIRWLFAFMSVHTSWESNISGYKAIKDFSSWANSPEILKKKIKKSRVGLHNNRTNYISAFYKDYWANPDKYLKNNGENWTVYRNRLKNEILGLGPAKTSFGIEMIYPNECEVVCMDTHLFKLYGLDQSRDLRQYEVIEDHWITMCKMYNVPSYIARCLFWDKNQNQSDSRYWSFVLES